MKLLTLLFLTIVNIGFSQTELDKICFKKINDYRSSKKISTLKWNDISFKAANHHCNFLKDSCEMVLSHHETILINPQDRLIHFGGTYTYIGENITLVSLNFDDNESLIIINDKISNEVIRSWKESPVHNKILLSNGSLAGVSAVIQKQSSGLIGVTNYLVWSTFVIYNP